MSSHAPQKRNRKSVDDKNSVECKLIEELERIKARVGMGYDLKVEWAPSLASDKHGEVRGNVILIYDGELEDSLQTLRHEFLDYLVSQAIVPYKNAANKLVQLVNEIAYKRKEEVVEALAKLLNVVLE